MEDCTTWWCFKAIWFYSGRISKFCAVTDLKDEMTVQMLIKMEVNDLYDKMNCCV